MKKFLSILFAAALCLGIFAVCSTAEEQETEAPTQTVTDTPTQAPETETPTEEPSEEPSEEPTEEPGDTPAEAPETDPAGESSTEIVTDPATFTDSLGITLAEPDGATDTAYYLVDGVIAEMSFTLDGAAYTLRATADAAAAETLAAAYEAQTEDAQNVEAVSGEETAPVTVYNTAAGGTVAVWSWGDVTMCLYTDMARTEAVINSIVNIASANAQPAAL